MSVNVPPTSIDKRIGYPSGARSALLFDLLRVKVTCNRHASASAAFSFRLMREAYFSGKSPPDRAPIASGPSPLQKAQRCDTFTGGDSAQCRRTNKETIDGRNNALYLIAKDVDDPA